MKRFLLFLTTFLTMVGSISVSAEDVTTGLVRIRNRRTTTAYLTTQSSGSAIATSKVSTGWTQIWIISAKGSGYTIRSAETGEYLNGTWESPTSAATTVYIQSSPNATGYFNISSKSDFSGQTCLNKTNSGTGITKWSYSGDAGSDWAILEATDIDEEEVKKHILSMSPYAGEIKENAYYRVVSCYGLCLTEGSDVTTKTQDETNFSQYWQLVKDGTGWDFKNVLTQKYISHQTQTSTPYHMVASKTAFNITRVADDWDYRFTINVGSEWGGLHDSSTQGHNVVYWSTDAEASEWHFVEVALSDEDIEIARKGQSEYEDLVKNKSKLQTALNNLFADKACTTLKDEIQALTDEALAENENFAALNADMKAMVLKVKNNTWQQFASKTTDYKADYEKFFRIADYKVYSHDEEMANSNYFTMSNSFGRLSGPTGIVAKAADILYVYVGANPKTTAELYLEAVSTDGVSGNHPTGELTELKAGLNLFRFSEQKMLYILHRIKSGTTGTNRKLSSHPDITVHIEGGQLNGYWDATRGMTNADWKLLQQDLLKAPYINLKTERLVFQMDTKLVLDAEPNEIEGVTRIWNTICANEERYMGVEDFDGYYNNVWNAFSGASSYMHATTRGTWYSEGTISTVMNYKKLSTQAGNLWGPSHEIGHNHQGSINVIGTTESSNNMFSNINTFESGILNSRRYYPHQNFDYIASKTPWLERNIWMTTGMFFQLYLYFHVQHHDDNFLPNLFRMMRKKPINKWSGPGNGGATSYGKDDYLHLAKMICDVAQADLSEFFEAYGMFIPVSMLHVGDYSNYDVTTTQAMINSAKTYMQKYEKKLGNIMFIDDRVIKKKANPDNIFGCVPASDGFKVANDEYPYLMANSTSSYIGGDYEKFTDDAQPVTDDWYKLSSTGKIITFQGTKNYAGHKFYDADGNLIWATNKRSATLPTVVTNLGIENVKIVTANYDMSDTPCTAEQPDAINSIQADNASSKTIYDLTGRRVEKAQKGLYIVNGRKVVR